MRDGAAAGDATSHTSATPSEPPDATRWTVLPSSAAPPPPAAEPGEVATPPAGDAASPPGDGRGAEDRAATQIEEPPSWPPGRGKMPPEWTTRTTPSSPPAMNWPSARVARDERPTSTCGENKGRSTARSRESAPTDTKGVASTGSRPTLSRQLQSPRSPSLLTISTTMIAIIEMSQEPPLPSSSRLYPAAPLLPLPLRSPPRPATRPPPPPLSRPSLPTPPLLPPSPAPSLRTGPHAYV